MQQETQVAIARELLGHLDANTAPMADEQMENPVGDYIDAAQFARERALIFRKQPIAVGYSYQLREPGDFITTEETGVPILVARDRAGKLNAFINACRHRGTLLVDEPCGAGRHAFVCPYHNWTYDSDGRLVTVPMESGFPGLDRAARGLVALPAAERFGIVWVLPTPGATLNLEDYLGADFCAELESYGFDGYHHFKTTLVPTAMNWKLMYDTLLEFYHAGFTHADTLRHLMLPNLVHIAPLGRHYRMVAAKKSFAELKGQPEAAWNLLDHTVVSYSIFPNLAINVHGDHVAFYRVFPDWRDSAKSTWSFAALTPEPAVSEKAVRYFEKNYDYVLMTGMEDVEMGERIQRTLASGANETVLFGGFESILSWHHRELARLLAAG